MKMREFGEISDGAPRFGLGAGHAEDETLASSRRNEIQHSLYGGAFSGAIGAEQSEDLSTLDAKGQPIDLAQPNVAPGGREILGEIANFYGREIHWIVNS